MQSADFRSRTSKSVRQECYCLPSGEGFGHILRRVYDDLNLAASGTVVNGCNRSAEIWIMEYLLRMAVHRRTAVRTS